MLHGFWCLWLSWFSNFWVTLLSNSYHQGPTAQQDTSSCNLGQCILTGQSRTEEFLFLPDENIQLYSRVQHQKTLASLLFQVSSPHLKASGAHLSQIKSQQAQIQLHISVWSSQLLMQIYSLSSIAYSVHFFSFSARTIPSPAFPFYWKLYRHQPNLIQDTQVWITSAHHLSRDLTLHMREEGRRLLPVIHPSSSHTCWYS